MPFVETDPLCGQSHPIKLSAGQKEYYYCSVSHSTVWLTSPITRERILNNGGGRAIRENPSEGTIESESGDEQLPRMPHPNFRPRSPLSSDPGPARCGSCGTVIRFGQTPCPRCQTPLTWEDEDVDPDLGI